jgi:hypothetical protein
MEEVTQFCLCSCVEEFGTLLLVFLTAAVVTLIIMSALIVASAPADQVSVCWRIFGCQGKLCICGL